jgi:hypothetical protein
MIGSAGGTAVPGPRWRWRRCLAHALHAVAGLPAGRTSVATIPMAPDRRGRSSRGRRTGPVRPEMRMVPATAAPRDEPRFDTLRAAPRPHPAALRGRPKAPRVNLPEPLRSPTSRPDDRRADRADGARERDLGLPAHPRRASQARLPRRSIHDPQNPQASAVTSGTAPVHGYVMATVPSHAGLDHAGRGLLPHRLRCDAEADLRVRRPRGCLWGSRSRHRACELRRSDSQARSQVCRYACST